MIALKPLEVWLDIPGWIGLYQASDLGRIRSVPRIILRKDGQTYTVRGKILKETKSRCSGKKSKVPDYLCVELCNNGDNKWCLIHRLVAETFIPNPHSKPFVNHRDGNKTNNEIDNLEWVTPQENEYHAAENGLKAWGERMWSAKLTLPQVEEIIEILSESRLPNGRYRRGIIPLLADKYKVSAITVRNIGSGWQWNSRYLTASRQKNKRTGKTGL